jgi:hypothetical protein
LDAITSYQQAVAILRETGDRHTEGQALVNLGVLYLKMLRRGQATTC